MQNKNGITLISLIAVISIIICLSGIIFSVAVRGLSYADKLKCLNNQRQIYQIFLEYVEDNHDSIPFAKGLDEKDPSIISMKDALARYADTDAIFYCPSDPRLKDKEFEAEKPEALANGSYDWNAKYFRGKNFSQVENKGDIILLGDFRSGWHAHKRGFIDWILQTQAESPENRKINVIYADGHSGYVTEKEWQENLRKYSV